MGALSRFTRLIPAGLGPTTTGFHKVLENTDYGLTADVVVAANKWVKICDYTVKAQTVVAHGYGNANQPDNQGYMYIRLDATEGVELEGKIRLTQLDAQENERETILEVRTERLKGSETDRKLMIPLPEQTQFKKVAQNSILRIEFYSTSGVTVDYDGTETKIRIPVTVRKAQA